MNVIVNYAMGNLYSVKGAFERIGIDLIVSSDPLLIENADLVVLPGVGSFGDAMETLQSLGLIEPLQRRFKASQPILGICLGMQLFFETSEESPGIKGLSMMKGHFRRIRSTTAEMKVPHMGWNLLNFKRVNEVSDYVYFVHSYLLEPYDQNCVVAHTDYGDMIPAIVQWGCLGGFQFHPEKSGPYGELLLKQMISTLLEVSHENISCN